MENIIWIQNYQSPCGELILGSLDGKLCLCDWMDENRRALIDRRLQKVLHARYETGESEVIVRAVAQLDEYFAGKRTEFDVELRQMGLSLPEASRLSMCLREKGLQVPEGLYTMDRMEKWLLEVLP